MAEVAVGLVGQGTELGVTEQLAQVLNNAARAVPATSDAVFVDQMILQPARAREIVMVDNCWLQLAEADAGGSLTVLSISAFLGGASGALANGGAVGINTQVPQSQTFPKVAGSTLTYAFEFAAVKTSIVARPNENLVVTFAIALRNAAAAPVNFATFETAFWRAAPGLG